MDGWWLIPVLFIVALLLELLFLKLLMIFRPICKNGKGNTDSQYNRSPTNTDQDVSEGIERDKMPNLIKGESCSHDNHSPNKDNQASSLIKHRQIIKGGKLGCQQKPSRTELAGSGELPEGAHPL
jgi:hypothetical protein